MKKTICVLISLLILTTLLIGCGEKNNWDSLILSEQLPQPDCKINGISDNTDKKLNVDFEIESKNEFEQYVTLCSDAGFTVDSQKYEDVYRAYNKEGYRLELSYVKTQGSNQKLLVIDLKTPIEMTDLGWPINDLAKMLPQPKSKNGSVENTTKDSLSVYVGDTSIEDYRNYVKDCTKAGFNVNSSESDTIFYGENKDGYIINIYNVGFNTMHIEFYSPDFFNTAEADAK